jgi:hypothetical protein
MQYPITVKEIKFEGEMGFKDKPLFGHKPGAWVAVRPCAKEYEGKTFLGVFLGDLACWPSVTYDKDTETLNFYAAGNPAMWVPDINKVVLGMESWWSEIKSPEDLKKITDKDIDNVWYVKALKAMDEGAIGKEEAKEEDPASV